MLSKDQALKYFTVYDLEYLWPVTWNKRTACAFQALKPLLHCHLNPFKEGAVARECERVKKWERKVSNVQYSTSFILGSSYRGLVF